MHRRACLMTFSCLVLLSAQVAVGNENRDGFYDRKDQGWFWKEPEPVEPEEVIQPEPEPVVLERPKPIEPEPGEEPIPMQPAHEGPRPFSPAWLREKLPKYRDLALEKPTRENVRAYYYVQRYSMDMAERFALTAQKVVLADPVLDENNRRPLSDYGARVFDERAKAATDRLAKKLAGQVGLWYFYRSDCPYCEAQNRILTNLRRRLDLAILPIALDGKPMPDGQFADFVPDRGHAEELQVRSTPTIFMVRPPNDFVLVSEGLVAESSLRQRMILGAHEAGWITDAEINATRPVNPVQIQAELGELSDETLNDPNRLVEILKSKITSSSF